MTSLGHRPAMKMGEKDDWGTPANPRQGGPCTPLVGAVDWGTPPNPQQGDRCTPIFREILRRIVHRIIIGPGVLPRNRDKHIPPGHRPVVGILGVCVM